MLDLAEYLLRKYSERHPSQRWEHKPLNLAQFKARDWLLRECNSCRELLSRNNFNEGLGEVHALYPLIGIDESGDVEHC